MLHTLYLLMGCRANGKHYVGQTVDLRARLKVHRCPGSTCVALRRAVARHGWDQFDVTVLGTTESRDTADVVERWLIHLVGSLAPRGYNLRAGGRSTRHSAETRARMSVSAGGRTT